MFSLIGSINTFSSPGRQHECRPIYGLRFLCIIFVYPLYISSRFKLEKKLRLEAMMDLHILLDPVTDF